ncbi:MAG: thiamine pyrophosphate-dependent enzyme [Bacteroidia bacterium]|nr:thiamine pyrophosphate-dependent enzyme [Bacteroidia bacterium]
MMQQSISIIEAPPVAFTREEILRDYRMAFQSRQASLLGRKEVLTGKAKFGIFGDGKELAQIAMAKAFQPGDIRSGYYRDQTFMFAKGISDIPAFFAQLYAIMDVDAEPASAGRQMNGHFATRMLNPDGSWKNLTEAPHSTADVSPTGSQMPRSLGIAYASKLYRNLPELKHLTQFSNNGNEISWVTIGNASTSEGMFFETFNAAGVMQVPLLISVWDDEYGISVPAKYHTTKQSISEALSGFIRNDKPGYEIFVVRGWDYPALCKTYQIAAEKCRREHVPVLVHVVEVTQPQGHSTSGSHERYKSKERLAWEAEHDCIRKFREWIIASGFATSAELDKLENQDKTLVNEYKKKVWAQYSGEIKAEMLEFGVLIDRMAANSKHKEQLQKIKFELEHTIDPYRRDIFAAIRKALIVTRDEVGLEYREALLKWKKRQLELNYDRYSSHLYSETAESALLVPEIKPTYAEDNVQHDGREILQACFDAALARDPRVIAFGEDVGQLGDVNQAFAGLQAKYGEYRVSDTGIRECTIIGQGIGLAMRGLRPIAEIQYLDYLAYAIQILSDDLATVRYRTKNGQIVRTRGHRLEGIWHSGSPMGMIINALRGMYVCVPRNMTQAAGMYNTLLRSDDPALIIEVLNGYRLKERIPTNIGEFTVPLGIPEILQEGSDVTLITYGACCRIALEAAAILKELNISVEVIDVQTLIPFDRHHKIVESLKKTNRIVFLDEDVQGGATGYMMQQVLEVQNGYRWLDSPPRTVTSKDHRPAYASDGDYFSKSNVEQVIETIYELMHEYSPSEYPAIF